MQIRIRDLSDPGSGMKKFESGIRYEHPGSATLPAGTVYFREKTSEIARRTLPGN
jgi:hypothetical protein